MARYLARVTVRADLDPDQIDGMAEALGAAGTERSAGAVLLWVPGEAPDGAAAELAARRHVAEVLEGLPVEVDVTEDPSS